MQFCMPLTFPRAFVFISSILLIGCSSSDRQEEIDDDYQYLRAVEQPALELPQDWQLSVMDDSYVLPEHQSKGELGSDLDLQSPPQLLALASGSRLDKNGIKNVIWFDRTTVVEDLPKFGFNALKGYLRQQQAEGSQFDEQQRSAVSGWITEVVEGGIWPWSSDDMVTSLQFHTRQQQNTNGTVTSFQADLTGMKVNGEEVAVSSLPAKDKLNYEVEFINGYIYYFQLIQERLLKKQQVEKVYEVSLKVSNNAQGDTVLRSKKNADVVWVHFRTLLEEVGFVVEDVDRSARKLFIEYQPKEQGFWQWIWSDDQQYSLNIPYGKYSVRVTTNTTMSVITLYDQNEQPVSSTIYGELIETFTEVAKQLSLEL